MVETEGQLRRRLLGEPPGGRRDVLFGWLGPLIAAVIGGVLRFWNLGDPHQLIFDETYYVKQGWSMILFGVEMRNDPVLNDAKQIDQNFTAGNVLQVYDPTTGDLVVHPPVGKWLIGWGEQLFGIDNSFGWRFAVCVMGVLSILMIGRAARRLFGSSLLGTVAALMLAFEGHHFVHSRTGLLDLILMFWAFAAFCFLLVDRDASRKVLARKVAGLDRAGTRRARSVGSVAGLASVAARGRGMPRAGLRDQVVRRVLPRRLRPDDGPVGHGRPPRGRHHPVEDRMAGQGHPARAAVDGRHHRRRLLPQLVGLVRDRHRVQPPLGRHPPRGARLGLGPGPGAVVVELPRPDPASSTPA